MKNLLLIFALLGPLIADAQMQVQRAYLGNHGEVLTETVNGIEKWINSLKPSTFQQMTGFPKKIPAHGTFKNFQNLTLADINDDGKEEILIATVNQLRVFKSDGTLLWTKALIGTPIYPPSVAPINASGELGIVQVTGGLPNNGRVYYLNAGGNDRPGWPVSFTSHWIICGPVIADINNDQVNEVIVQTRTSNNLHVLKLDGTVMWSANLGATPAVTPSVADIDNDGIIDIVTGTSNGILHAFNGNGTIKTGFPVPSDNCSFSYQSPLLVDFDGNNQLSIVGAAHGNAPKFFVRKNDGSYRTGWPVAVPENNWTYSAPSVVDWTGNNDFRIFASIPVGESPAPMLYGFNPDGSTMDHFPITKAGGLESFISVADINADGSKDLIFASNLMVNGQGFIHAFNTNGTGEISGFPLRPTGFTYMNGATLGDINGDGKLDLAAFSYEQTFSPADSAYINVYELNVPVSQAKVLFGTYKGRNDRSGHIKRTVIQGVETNNLQSITHVFPNPSRGKLTIQSYPMKSITVQNMLGQTVYKVQLNNSTQTTINTSNWENGVYYFHIETLLGISKQRLVVSK